ncbi:hypothetical protein D3C76_1204310 [compost metagenome]
MFAAVRLGHCDLQVAAVAGCIQVIDFECARCDGGFVQGYTALSDQHSCVTAGDTAHHWCIAAQRGGQHAIVAGQAYAGVAQRIEQPARGVAFTQCQLRAPGGDITLGIAGNALVALLALVAPVQRTIMAQAPRPDIEPGTEPQVGLAKIALAAMLGAVGVEVVIEKTRCYAAVPL